MISAKLPSLPPVPAPGAAPIPASTALAPAPAHGRSFADRLQQARHEQPHADKPKPQAPETPQTGARSSEGARSPAGHAARAPATTARASAKATSTAPKEPAPDKAEAVAEHGAEAEEDTPDAAGLEGLLPGWNASAAPADAAAVPAAAAATLAAADAMPEEDTLASRDAAGAVSTAATAARRTATHAGGPALVADAASAGAAASAEAKATQGPTAARTDSAPASPAAQAPAAAQPDSAAALTAPSLPTAATGHLPGTAPTGGTAPTFEARLSAALGSPDFAPALGVQVSILAREGVQQARLHLNPAEMGPIAVQIAVDGQNAQVHFQADVAATRDALESSLPDLAAALREGGFTLSGGGVSQQRQDPAGNHSGSPAGADDGPSRSARGDDTSPASTPLARAPRPQGVVDLYA
ncbi:flagellar hook-length control protein FliK [Ideonella sp. BN130291]|uniref:flagellar hook-length control protein FliK n=1 Tax=Ideonella sp. BN130291 TaxID=3112940 RepID=UPI002E27409B|nr:flagellar hook-length control protein FliK [Ideonella sp. BN130291]